MVLIKNSKMQIKMKLVVQHFLVSSIWFSNVIGAGLHGACENDQECGTIDTFCHKNVCVCKENFAVLFDSCIALAQPRHSCNQKGECHKVLGPRSICTKKKQCACKPFHHLHMGQCVKNRDLSHQCEHDHQCYCGAGCEDRIACIHNNCTCNPEYLPFGARRCLIPQNEGSSTVNTKEADLQLNVTSTSDYVTEKITITTEFTKSNVTKNASVDEEKQIPSVVLSSAMSGLMMNTGFTNFLVSFPMLISCICFIKLV